MLIHDINVEVIKYMFPFVSSFIDFFLRICIWGNLCAAGSFVLFLVFTDEFEFFSCHVALLKDEFIARILVPLVAFLLMWLLETGDFDSLTHLN